MSVLLYAFIMGVFLYGILRGIEAIIKHQRDLNRSTIIRLDETGNYELERRHIKKAEIRNGQSKDGTIEILEGGGRYTGDKGNLWILHKRHGWNLRVPTDQETIGADQRLATFAICNPASYYQAERRNDARDALDANQEPEPWYGKLAMPLMVLGIAVVAMLGYVVVKIQGAT